MKKPIKTYLVQVSYGEIWDDIKVRALTPEGAINKAIAQFRRENNISSYYIKAVI